MMGATSGVRTIWVAAAVLAAVLASLPTARSSQDNPKPIQAPNLAGLHDFDLRVGKWRGHNRRLKERLAGSHEWVEFDGTQTFWQVMDGYANVDENVLSLPTGTYRGLTLRAYDPKSGQWAIWWLDGRDPFGDLDPPVKGSFVNGVGTFYSNDTLRGKPVRVRFTWSHITRTGAHWEQAFSPDGGKTWETNWTTDFERVAD
jgi:hypothetical protein